MNKKTNIRLIDPYPMQASILKAVQDSTISTVTCCLGRGAGKSILLENIAIFYCINFPRMKILIISPTESNNNKIYDDILTALANSQTIERSSKQSGSAIIKFKNESKIMFRTGSNENARGLRADIIIIDEAAKIKKEIIESVFIPILAGSKIGKTLLFSTPRGNNWFKDYFLKAHTNPKYASFRCSSYDSPYVSDELIENFRETLPTKVFEQEVEAKFIDGASIFNNVDSVMCLEQSQPVIGEIYYGGIDVGLINDATVVSIINNKGDLVEQIAFEKVETPELLIKLEAINNKWKFKKCYIETNGQGLPVYQSLKRQMKCLLEFNTNASSKPKMIDKLIYLFNTEGFKIKIDADLKYELESFIFIQKEGKLKYQADMGSHDDRVMSLAIARQCYEDFKSAGNGIRAYKVF